VLVFMAKAAVTWIGRWKKKGWVRTKQALRKGFNLSIYSASLIMLGPTQSEAVALPWRRSDSRSDAAFALVMSCEI
jgi:hypothetical protein